MFPDLSYFFHAVFGSEPDNWSAIFKTFGVFLALSFVGAAWVLSKELKRKEEDGLIQPIEIKRGSASSMAIKEALLNGLIAFIIGYKIPFIWKNFEAFKANPAGGLFSSEGHLFLGLLIGGLVAMYYYFSAKNTLDGMREGNQTMHAYQRVGDIIIVTAISGVVGSRLFSVLENFDDFIRDPLGQIFSGSGLTVYGGLILGFITVYWYVKKLGIKPVHVMDATGLCFPLAYAIGRMGCQFSGDGDWGIVNVKPKPDWFIFPDWAWSYDYPYNVLKEGIPMKACSWDYCMKLAEGVYPTPIYEIIGSLMLFFILWFNRKRFKSFGLLFFTFLLFNGIMRFFVEMIRVNPRYDLLGLEWSMSQGLGFLFALAGLIGIIVIKRNNKKPKGPVNYSQIGHGV